MCFLASSDAYAPGFLFLIMLKTQRLNYPGNIIFFLFENYIYLQ